MQLQAQNRFWFSPGRFAERFAWIGMLKVHTADVRNHLAETLVKGSALQSEVAALETRASQLFGRSDVQQGIARQ